ncbi:protein-serine/threonine phosphatase [Ranunculus cassubicifolius]
MDDQVDLIALEVYKTGGASAVFQSSACPQWNLGENTHSHSNSNSYMLQGRRNYQEDRTLCHLDLRIPFPGRTVTVGIAGVFDGHIGAEASEMASKSILDYFLLHVHFQTLLRDQSDNSRWFHMDILKESLLMAIYDIDLIFSEEARRNNSLAGSTAVIVLIVDNHLLAVNVGDSKAILCSETVKTLQDKRAARERFYRQRKSQGDSTKKYQPGPNHFSVMELTRDHHPDRDDERSRIESLGGFVEESRVNGQLAVSRSIGDVPFKRYGVISMPEVAEWRPLSANDTYLVVASDGIFEKMTTKDVCDVLWDVYEGKLDSCKGSSLAEFVVNAAFESGSADNLSAIVVPLKSPSAKLDEKSEM